MAKRRVPEVAVELLALLRHDVVLEQREREGRHLDGHVALHEEALDELGLADGRVAEEDDLERVARVVVLAVDDAGDNDGLDGGGHLVWGYRLFSFLSRKGQTGGPVTSYNAVARAMCFVKSETRYVAMGENR